MEPLEIKGVEKEPLTFDLESLEINVPGVKVNTLFEKVDNIEIKGKEKEPTIVPKSYALNVESEVVI